jgi:hypothetical protein
MQIESIDWGTDESEFKSYPQFYFFLRNFFVPGGPSDPDLLSRGTVQRST